MAAKFARPPSPTTCSKLHGVETAFRTPRDGVRSAEDRAGGTGEVDGTGSFRIYLSPGLTRSSSSRNGQALFMQPGGDKW